MTNRKLRIAVPLGKKVNVIQGVTVGIKGMSNVLLLKRGDEYMSIYYSSINCTHI